MIRSREQRCSMVCRTSTVEMRFCRLCCNSMPNLRSIIMDDYGRNHVVHQGEGGEQGDALMPMLHSLGQHESICSFTWTTSTSCAFLNGTTIHKLLEQSLEQCAGIQVHLGKTQVWNRGGHVHPGCAASVWIRMPGWRGGGLPNHEQGIRVFVSTTKKHTTLHERIHLFRTSRARGSSSSSVLTPVQRTHSRTFHPTMKWQTLERAGGHNRTKQSPLSSKHPRQHGRVTKELLNARRCIMLPPFESSNVVLLSRTTRFGCFVCPFAFSQPCIFLMPHKGWTSVPVPDGWLQVI